MAACKDCVHHTVCERYGETFRDTNETEIICGDFLVSVVDAPPSRADILDMAKRCVCGDREQDYGSPEDNFERIGTLWEVYMAGKCTACDVCIQAEDVAAMLALLKIARIASGHGKTDNWVDLAGYASCGGEIEGRKVK